MLRQYESRIILAIFAFCVIGFAFQAGRSTQHQDDRKQIEAGYKERLDHPPPQEADKRGGEASEITFVGLKLGEGLLIFATVWLVLVTKALVDGGRESSEKQLRAYVLVDTVVVSNVVNGSGVPEAHVAIKNFGQTPAYKFVNITGFAIDKYPPPPTIELTVPESEFNALITRTNLGPTQSEVSITDWGPERRTISDGEREAIVAGRRIIFVYGEIRYIDAFGHPRWTKYRFVIGGPVGVRGNGQMAGCPEGNDAS